ncbi:hypothetical protein Q9189_006387 [Teloschistes chrysophthalmus]
MQGQWLIWARQEMLDEAQKTLPEQKLLQSWHFCIYHSRSSSACDSCLPLVLPPELLAKCPNIESIATHDWRWIHSNVDGDYTQRHSWELVVSAGRAKTLRHFEVMEWWTLERLEAVYRNTPEIQSLAMLGGRYHEGIKILLPVLGRFSHLTSLSLADIGSIGVDYTAPGCGNPYLGPRGDDPVHVWSEHKSPYTRKRDVRFLKCLPEDFSVEFRDDEGHSLQTFQSRKSM